MNFTRLSLEANMTRSTLITAMIVALSLTLIACSDTTRQDVNITLPAPSQQYAPDAGMPTPNPTWEDGGQITGDFEPLPAPDQKIKPPKADAGSIKADQMTPPPAADSGPAADTMPTPDMQHPDSKVCPPGPPVGLQIYCFDRQEANGKSHCNNKIDSNTNQSCWSPAVWTGQSTPKCAGQASSTQCAGFDTKPECCYGDANFAINRQCRWVCGATSLSWTL